ncbi:energy transducer TonB [Sphingomonas morindae]|uniref:Energy transducer TonB n=1 Tax=Sphingomonas morindae TaxID=1541170 RepID=A0ABY4X6X2_9SPHN|nr:energy transducer TonB [Sphingomonas morindae]USI72655.1 energy transducer TonB [Sphingomonas morindae]
MRSARQVSLVSFASAFLRSRAGFAAALLGGALLFAPLGWPEDDLRPGARRPDTPSLQPLPPLLSAVGVPRAAPCDPAAGATRPRPATSPQSWVLTEDYPLISLFRNETGRTGFALRIAPDGAVMRCDRLSGSGSPWLDGAACAALMRRARFTPAMDGRGCPIGGTYRNAVIWQIPQATAGPN